MTHDDEHVHSGPCYYLRKRRIIIAVYVMAFIFWGFLGWAFNLLTSAGPIGLLIFLGPWVTFTITIISLPYINLSVEEHLFKTNFLSLGLLVAIPLLGVMSANYGGNADHYLAILLAAIVCSLLSLVDLWVGYRYLSVTKHIKSILQQYSIFLLIFAVYLYFRHAQVRVINLPK